MLPTKYNSYSDYFGDAIEFLEKYSWVFQESNTKLVKSKVLENVPESWRSYFNDSGIFTLNLFPFGILEKNAPKDLQKFQKELQDLQPEHKLRNFKGTIKLLKGMSPQKMHEVLRLASYINEHCLNDSKLIIDVGSGLGYLTELLAREQHYEILGLEGKAERVANATKRQGNLYSFSKKNVFFVKHFITSESKIFIEQEISRKFSKTFTSCSATIVGLHTCGDLSVIAIKLFLSLQSVKRLIIMPCCYHKMKIYEGNDKSQIFENFPCSSILTETKCFSKNLKIFDRPFMRLSCQWSSLKWKNMTVLDHEKHSLELFARNLIECLADIDQEVKKINKSKEFPSLEFNQVQKLFQLKSKSDCKVIEWNSFHENKFNELIMQYRQGAELLEIITCLQTALQELCENLVLLDRVCFAIETAKKNGIEVNVKIDRIFDEGISPRNHVLFLEKGKLFSS